jgi:hypothetical protein
MTDCGTQGYSTTTCPTCGAQIEGLDNRYACALCGWISPPDDRRPGHSGEEQSQGSADPMRTDQVR